VHAIDYMRSLHVQTVVDCRTFYCFQQGQ